MDVHFSMVFLTILICLNSVFPTKITARWLSSIDLQGMESILSSSNWEDEGASWEVGSEPSKEYFEGISNIKTALCAVQKSKGAGLRRSLCGSITLVGVDTRVAIDLICYLDPVK